MPASECIFCKIVQRQSPSHIIYEDDKILAFLDIAPLTRGHTLVIPKSHCTNLLECPTPLVSYIAEKIPWLAKGIMATVGSTAFNVLQNNGATAGQVVFHLHFHILPRFRNDGRFPNHAEEGDESTAPKTIVRPPTLTKEDAVPLAKQISRQLVTLPKL
ncbi:histidine triad domain protein [Chytridium lagenaria]|nr:histidine triad domain protein [Chytridium lagenaria]